MQNNFVTVMGERLSLPLFFPDATRGRVKQLSWEDVRGTGLSGVLVNTFHLLRLVGREKTIKAGGIRPYLQWKGAIISDSGGFQVMSIAKKSFGHAQDHQKKGNGVVTDEGVTFEIGRVKHFFTPEDSIKYQLTMRTDLVVVLDDFTPPNATHKEAEITVIRTTQWARKCKEVFDYATSSTLRWHGKKPYLIGVVQGGEWEDLRLRSIKELTEIGFDGYGYGGWPMKDGKFDTATAKLIAEKVPKEALLYGLGIGKPDDIVACVKMGWQIFDCVLPTRDARHGRLYVYTAKKIDSIKLDKPRFYKYYSPRKAEHLKEKIPISTSCDCELCTTLTRAEFAKMWREKDIRVLRLSTIHNLRFYAILMEKLKKGEDKAERGNVKYFDKTVKTL